MGAECSPEIGSQSSGLLNEPVPPNTLMVSLMADLFIIYPAFSFCRSG